MPHDTGASVRKLQVLQRGKKCPNFDLDRLGQKLPRTRTQDIRQWIVDLFGLTKRDNVGSVIHGVSLSLRGSGRLDHPPRYAAYLMPSSPTFPHSSRKNAPGSNSHQKLIKDNQNLKDANPYGAPADACKRAVLVPYV
jgi:hypothetical protein